MYHTLNPIRIYKAITNYSHIKLLSRLQNKLLEEMSLNLAYKWSNLLESFYGFKRIKPKTMEV